MAKKSKKINLKKIKEKLIDLYQESKKDLKKSLMSLGILLVVVIVLGVLINILSSNNIKNLNYPLVYRRDNGELTLLKNNQKSSDAKVLTTMDGVGYTTYSNKSNKYVLYKKSDALFLYDVSTGEEPTKVANDASVFNFSDDDSFVFVLDADNDLFSYNYKEAKQLLDNNVSRIVDYSAKSIVYEKNEKLYFVSFDPSKEDKTEVVSGFNSAEYSENGKYVMYKNTNNTLYRYNTRNEKHTKIADKVDTYYCVTDSCDKLYYTVSDEYYDLYYYSGKGKMIAEKINDEEANNTDENMIVYTKSNGSKYELYYQKGTSKARKISNDYTEASSIKLLNDDLYYTNENKELVHVKIKGSRIGKTTVVDKEITSELYDYKDGIYYYNNADDKNNASYYIVKNGKKIKIADDIKTTRVAGSNDGKKIYYIKDVEVNSGTLYVFDGKNSKKITDDVYRFLYIRDDVVYYLKDYNVEKRYGDLYRYGKTSEKVESEVSELASTPNGYIVK